MSRISSFFKRSKARFAEMREEGFTMIEIAVAVGIILILSVAGIIGYGVIQGNSEQAALESAAQQGVTAVLAYSADGSSIADAITEAEGDLTTDDVTVTIDDSVAGEITVLAEGYDGKTATRTAEVD